MRDDAFRCQISARHHPTVNDLQRRPLGKGGASIRPRKSGDPRQRVLHRQVDESARSGHRAPAKCSQNEQRRRMRRSLIGNRDSNSLRPVTLSNQTHKAALSLHDTIERGPRTHRAAKA